MAQGANLDTTWRGLREIVSPIVGLTRSQVEALSALGLTGEIDGEFFIVVGVGRGNVPVATKYWVNKKSYVMTVAQCYELLSLELFDIIVDQKINSLSRMYVCIRVAQDLCYSTSGLATPTN